MKSNKSNFLPGIIIILLITNIFSAWPQGKVQTIGRYLCIDYKPFFPIGLYHLPNRRNDDVIWKEVADAGFNFSNSSESGRHGIYVAKPVPWKEINGKRVNLMELYRDPSMLEELKDFLSENEDDPTMLMWHAPDEPCWFGPSANALQLGYEAIKANSKKPVWMNVGPSINSLWHYNIPKEFMEICDVISEDIYPIPDGKTKIGQGYNKYTYYVGEHTEKMVELGSVEGIQKTPVWMILQGFGWADFDSFGNPKDYVPPTGKEIRYMSYDAIVHGATGLMWYGPFDTKSDDLHAEFWENLKDMATELRDIYDVLTCPFELVPEKLLIKTEHYTDDNPVRWLIKLVNDKVYVIAVNTRPEPTGKVTFSLLDDREAHVSKVNVLFENREASVSDNISWTDEFEGYGVHVYETDIYYRFMRRYYEPPVKE